MARHVIVGAGPVGSATATALAEAGNEVRVVTRTGGGPRLPGVERVAANAADRAVLTGLARDADAIYNCANPPYHRWARDWPPLADSLLRSAEDTGAVLVTMGNLYGYGPVDHPMTEGDPLAATSRKGRIRVAMWEQALAAHQTGRVRVTEARASDYFGPEVTAQGHIGSRFIPPLLAGKRTSVIGDPDVPHSWTYVPDIARALVVLGSDERAWGRAWHVPTNPPATMRWMAVRISAMAGAPSPRIATIPHPMLRALGLVSPIVRELEEVRYQFVRPFVLDSSAFTTTFGLAATPLDHALRATVEWWRARLS